MTTHVNLKEKLMTTYFHIKKFITNVYLRQNYTSATLSITFGTTILPLMTVYAIALLNKSDLNQFNFLNMFLIMVSIINNGKLGMRGTYVTTVELDHLAVQHESRHDLEVHVL